MSAPVRLWRLGREVVTPGRQKVLAEEYNALHAGPLAERQAKYATLANRYYDLVTDFYRYRWGDSFHFAARRAGEDFPTSLVRHQRRLAERLGLRPGMTVVDLGSGVGGPLREIARFSGACVIGLNNHAYQVALANRLNREADLDPGRGHGIRGDFMAMPFADASLDAAYSLEGLPHAPDRRRAYAEIFRVLRPGASLAGNDWCMTARYDAEDPEHRAVKKGIEIGNGVPDIGTADALEQALGDAGFEVIETRDLARDGDEATPWWGTLAEGGPSAWRRRTPLGRWAIVQAARVLETLHLVPRGLSEVCAILITSGKSLVRAGQLGIFTPLHFFHVRKPGPPVA